MPLAFLPLSFISSLVSFQFGISVLEELLHFFLKNLNRFSGAFGISLITSGLSIQGPLSERLNSQVLVFQLQAQLWRREIQAGLFEGELAMGRLCFIVSDDIIFKNIAI